MIAQPDTVQAIAEPTHLPRPTNQLFDLSHFYAIVADFRTRVQYLFFKPAFRLWTTAISESQGFRFGDPEWHDACTVQLVSDFPARTRR